MSESLKLKSIYELIENKENFFIPSYQRGYRWTKQQVEELLEDIWEFAQDVESNKNSGFYCLQPIVIKASKKEGFNWDVVDGQQRLTTIYILLKYFEQQTKKTPYKIGYETRDRSQEFLEKISNKLDEKNIDFFHMSNAFITIEERFKDKDFANINLFLTRLLQKPNIQNNIDIAKNIRVIWYEIESVSEQSDIEVFTRINMGKIPLTNAELIKALLIQGYSNQHNGKVKDNKQFELASEWDFIEYSLQNDDFWYFINKEKNEQATRIEFIFELIAKNYLKHNNEFAKILNASIDKYYTFHILNHYLQNDIRSDKEKTKKTIYEELWSEVKNYFRILNEWYEDRELFHKIGFLVIYSEIRILDFIDKYAYSKKTKKEFRSFLDEQIKEVFKNKKEFIDIDSLRYENTSKATLNRVLLWFNISTIVKNDKSNLRFQFDRYKKQSWDIEHIRSQTDKYPTKKEEKEAWIEDISKISDIKKTKNEILDMDIKEFNEFFNEMQKTIEGDDSNFDKDGIGNLTLLDSKTNRSYGNAFFPIKRKIIIGNDMNGTFIPICTKNLFLKYYSEEAINLQKWTNEDAESYKNKIRETFIELEKGTLK
jgi:uncharacterized protein with ParB-like and HNH nuclease domain